MNQDTLTADELVTHFPIVSTRLNGVEEYYFSKKLRQIDEMNQTGKKVINLGIGSPDLPPHPDVIATLQKESAHANNHAYQNYKGCPILRNAIADWYQKWYGVNLEPATEILPLIGSKEGIMHICMTYLNSGDAVLIPNPGYPTYKSAAQIAGANIQVYTLDEKNDWLPDFEALEKQDLTRTKLMFVNYPHMPTGRLPTTEMFEQLIAFAKRNQILICHDNPYSFIQPGFLSSSRPSSLLSITGAKEVVIELNSLSKSHSMAGWRIGFLSGSENRIKEILRFKTNMDSGIFLPLQLAAAKALQLSSEWYISLNEIYNQRRKKVNELLELLNCTFSKEQVGLFVWAKVPDNFKDGFYLSDRVLELNNLFITPGGIFGSAGEKYIRVSLCTPENKLEEAIQRIKNQN
ncbi:MAG: aminotransferase class I/II-fold pyridoxal phosphate-dependent enzyme [Ginsengibacter sp.]|jgi:aspartate/methionine/tyrosine aminotransferase